ncbi:hypothetical protein HU200_017068 [Digitaria exilis]|uniref:RING-type E3 ubiquitin transferase n=1 Tax=Digitaria exilis TaxID=1010633 RepID=A0A835KK62_9POAL|nr:hypothetical protein HU200_017068 [Digitaria exilis]CAB3451373.1 unnamed protein product [Digitaria exilis]
MVIIAGMLPGVECARRRRVRQGGSAAAAGAAEAPCGTRRQSFCLHTGGHDHAHLGSAAASKVSCLLISVQLSLCLLFLHAVWWRRYGNLIGFLWEHQERSSSVCKETMMARAWTLDSNAREAKERLDQKLRGQRESSVIIKRHQSAGTVRPPTTAKPHATSASNGGNNLHHSATAAPPCAVQREVFSKAPPTTSAAPPRQRRFSWTRLGRCAPPPPPEAEAEAECAVCLDELRAGDVVAHLPCAHRFHWSCAEPWVRAASRCPVCRARVHLAAA